MTAPINDTLPDAPLDALDALERLERERAELQARIVALTAENAQLRDGLDEEGLSLAERCCAAVKDQLIAERDELRARLERAEADAARYRWLKAYYDIAMPQGEPSAAIFINDAEIDVALSAWQGTGENEE